MSTDPSPHPPGRGDDDGSPHSMHSAETRPYGAAESGSAATEGYGRDETQPYGLDQTQAHDADVTRAYDSDVTQAYGAPDSTAAPDGHGLTTGQQITLGSESYLVETCISSGTGEAAVYRIWTAEGEARVLKLYRGFSDARHEPNPEALRRIQQIEDDDILRLYAFGTGTQKYLGRFCYEIAAFAQGGTLLDVPDLRAKYTRTFVEREVVPQLIKGIRALHSRQIYHCDLKPQNVFYLDRAQQDLVIGDYGSAKTRDAEAARSLAVTSMAKGTDFYLAPEQARGVVSEKNDYYSMGMVLLHLLYPEAASRQNLNRILERQMMGQPIWEFRRDAGRLNELVAGLTLANHVLRWGYAEVERWLDGKAVTVSYGGAVHVDSIKPIKLGKAVIRTEADLVAYIEEHDDWYELLIEDRQGWQALLVWISEVRDLSEKRRLEALVREYQAIGATEEMGSAYVRVGVLRFLEPERPIRVDMQEYDFSAGDVREQAKHFFRQLYDMRHATDIKHIRLWVFEMELALAHNNQQDSAGASLLLQEVRETAQSERWVYESIDSLTIQCLAFTADPSWGGTELNRRIAAVPTSRHEYTDVEEILSDGRHALSTGTRPSDTLHHMLSQLDDASSKAHSKAQDAALSASSSTDSTAPEFRIPIIFKLMSISFLLIVGYALFLVFHSGRLMPILIMSLAAVLAIIITIASRDSIIRSLSGHSSAIKQLRSENALLESEYNVNLIACANSILRGTNISGVFDLRLDLSPIPYRSPTSIAFRAAIPGIGVITALCILTIWLIAADYKSLARPDLIIHGDGVYSASVMGLSTDGTLLAAEDGVLRDNTSILNIWRADSGHVVQRITVERFVNSAASGPSEILFSASSRYILRLTTYGMQVWDTTTGEEVSWWQDDRQEYKILGGAFTPDDSSVILLQGDYNSGTLFRRSIRLRDGRVLSRRTFHDFGQIVAHALSPDGSRLAVLHEGIPSTGWVSPLPGQSLDRSLPAIVILDANSGRSLANSAIVGGLRNPYHTLGKLRRPFGDSVSSVVFTANSTRLYINSQWYRHRQAFDRMFVFASNQNDSPESWSYRGAHESNRVWGTYRNSDYYSPDIPRGEHISGGLYRISVDRNREGRMLIMKGKDQFALDLFPSWQRRDPARIRNIMFAQQAPVMVVADGSSFQVWNLDRSGWP